MANVIIISADPVVAAGIEETVLAAGSRPRLLATPATAREWLSMSQYDVLLIDVQFGQKAVMELVQLAWKYNPLMVCATYHNNSDFDFKWDATIAGVVVLTEPNLFDQIAKLLSNLPTEEPSSQFSILLVEDLDAPRDIITTYIESLGFPKVQGVKSAKEALELLEKNPTQFGCVVTDYNMPEMNGAELIAEMRRDEQLHSLPAIVLTAYSTIDNLIDCIKAGATGFLVKPPRKKSLRVELEKARRILYSKRSPRLCSPEEAHLLEEALARTQAR